MDDTHTPQDNNVEIPADGAAVAVVVDTPVLDENRLHVQEQAMADSVPSSDFESLMREYEEGEEEENEDEDEEDLVHVHVQQGQSEEEEQENAERNDNDDEEEYSDDDEEIQPPYGPVILPMPDLSGFTITLPGQDAPQPSPSPPPPPPAPLAPLPDILHVPDLLKPYDLDDPSPSLQGLQVCHIGRETKLGGEMQAMYLRLPPGTRMSRKSSRSLELFCCCCC